MKKLVISTVDLSKDHGLREARYWTERGFDRTAQTQRQPHLLTRLLIL